MILGYDHGERHEFARWILAAAIVLTAHGGLMAGYFMLDLSGPSGAPQAPAVLVDLAPMPVAPASQVDLAPGPEMVEAQAAPKPTAQPEVKPDEPLPKVEGLGDVTLQTAEQKPVEKETEEKVEKPPEPKPMKAEEQPPAPVTTAPPRSEAVIAPVTAAPSLGSADARAAIASWRDRVVAQLQRAKRYPGGAEARREQGVVMLTFTVNRQGQVTARSIAKSSGHPDLDQEVLAMVQRASPFPALPASMAEQAVQLTAPIRFSLR